MFDWSKFKTVRQVDGFMKTNSILQKYNNILCALSGGSDSDIVLDILSKTDYFNKIKFVFYDTGIEYEATKKHLEYLENKYNINIEKVKTKKPVPLSCKKYGVPFISKYISEMIHRLQHNNFKWEDLPFDILIKKYPKCNIALKWWCNANGGGV